MLQGAPVAVDTQLPAAEGSCLLHPAIIGKLLSPPYRVAYACHVDQATLVGWTKLLHAPYGEQGILVAEERVHQYR